MSDMNYYLAPISPALGHAHWFKVNRSMTQALVRDFVARDADWEEIGPSDPRLQTPEWTYSEDEIHGTSTELPSRALRQPDAAARGLLLAGRITEFTRAVQEARTHGIR